MLHEFIEANSAEIVRRCRAKVALRSIPPPTESEIEHGVPVFLGQLQAQLRLGLTSTPEINATAILHGRDLRAQGLTVSQVVHDYGDVCQAITELAVERKAPISSEDFQTLNRCLDDAIAGAVTEFGREQNQSTLDGEVARAAFLAHETRNLVNTAILAFEVVKTGNVGLSGSTGTVLLRSLMGLRTLATRSIAEIRVLHAVQNREQLHVSEFIAELAPAATLEAHDGEVTLVVLPVEDGVKVEADRQILNAVVTNLLQNAFKFTLPRSTVTLRVGAGPKRVLIEVQDECGGLPTVNVDGLFNPFEQRGADRTGLGLGLAFSRASVEAINGRIYARNLAGKGCIFTVDLPRVVDGDLVAR